MARLPDGTEIDGKKLGACVIVMTPKGFVFIEKPLKQRGYECPGGHGEEEDESLQECAARELAQETGIYADLEDLRLIDEPRIRHTLGTSEIECVTGMFLLQLSYMPKLKKFGNDGEIVHLVKQRDLRTIRVFPPHFSYLTKAMNMLDVRRWEQQKAA